MQPLGPAWVEVDLDALEDNMRGLRRLVPQPTLIMAVVKADGYGHGIREAAEAFLAGGADWLGVADLWEAQKLREANIKAPLLVFAPAPNMEKFSLSLDVRSTVCDLETARALASLARKRGKTVKVHMKVDCGMGRLGVLPGEAGDFAGQLIRLEGLELEGIYTHFPQADNSSLTRRQLAVFLEAEASLKARGIQIPLVHAANSTALLRFPPSHLGMVRPGTVLYGQGAHGLSLHPTWRLKTNLVYTRLLPQGHRVGYGGEYKTSRPTLAGVLPLGYADGLTLEPALRSPLRRLLAALQGFFHVHPAVWIDGKQTPFLGRVSMNMASIRLPENHREDTVELAARRTTISRRLPKVYLRDGRPCYVLQDGCRWSIVEQGGIYYRLDQLGHYGHGRLAR
jgi:alanine racemase